MAVATSSRLSGARASAGSRRRSTPLHVAYVVIDGAVDGLVRQFLPDKPHGFFVQPGAIAETVYHLTQQPGRSNSTFRTSTEKW